jgi:hypothetical protein
VRERIEYRFRVLSAAVFTLYLYSKALEYRFRVPTAGSLKLGSPIFFFLAQPLITVASSHYIERGGADKQQYYSRPKGDISLDHMHKQRQAQRSTNRVT